MNYFSYLCSIKDKKMIKVGNLNIESYASVKQRGGKTDNLTTSYVKVKSGSNPAPKKNIKLIKVPEGTL